MSRLGRRLGRLLGASRIRLERHPLAAADLAAGDWVEIEGEAWRVRERLTGAASGAHAFALEAARGMARAATLVACATPGGLTGWALVRDGRARSLPAGSLTRFPAAAADAGAGAG